jgi:hypothetical protein
MFSSVGPVVQSETLGRNSTLIISVGSSVAVPSRLTAFLRRGEKTLRMRWSLATSAAKANEQRIVVNSAESSGSIKLHLHKYKRTLWFCRCINIASIHLCMLTSISLSCIVRPRCPISSNPFFNALCRCAGLLRRREDRYKVPALYLFMIQFLS